jgi:phosphoglycolate phosphatase-like HAD superfamily hydrolase
MAEPKKLILFDLVSTLTDAGPRYAEAYIRMAAAYNQPVPSREDILKELGQRNLKDIIALHSPGLPPEKIQDFMKDCNQTCDKMLYDLHWLEKLYANARQALADLKSRGFTLGLYTGTRQDAMEAQLRYHNIAQYFDADLIRAKDNVRDAGKTTQDLKIEQIASILQSWKDKNPGADPARDVIMVGDTLSDMEAAQANQIRFAGFAENQAKFHSFLQNGVKAVFSGYDKAAGILAAMFVPPASPPRKSNPPGLHS